MELVSDDASAEQYERCTEVFERMIAQGDTYEDIVKICIQGANDAEASHKLQEVDDFTLIGLWAQFRADAQDQGAEQGKAVSNRMAGERQRRRDIIDDTNAVRDAFPFDEVKQMRQVRRARERDAGPSLA